VSEINANAWVSSGHRPMGFPEFVVIIASIMALNPLAMDMMLPALPNIASAFHLADANRPQMVLSTFIIGFGVGQFVMGPLSDRFGRRPVLLGGMTVYCIASLLAIAAPSFETLLLARALQGLCTSATRVIATSIVRDCYAGRRMASVMSLAMMVFTRGLAKTVSGGMKISTAITSPNGTYRQVDVPGIFRFIDSRIFGGHVSVVTLIFVICAILSWIALTRHFLGRQLYAIGGNEEAARLSGVPVKFTKVLAYAASGFLAAVAGICQAAQEQQGDPEAGIGYELTAIAIVVIGGTTLSGGRGGIGLTLLGTLTIGYLEKILSINAVPEASRLMLTGAIIVIAVLAQKRRRA